MSLPFTSSEQSHHVQTIQPPLSLEVPPPSSSHIVGSGTSEQSTSHAAVSSSSSSGNTTPGNTTSGSTTSGSTTSGNTTSGNTTSGNTTSGNTTSGNTTSGNTTSGNTTSGNTTSGNTTSGNTGTTIPCFPTYSHHRTSNHLRSFPPPVTESTTPRSPYDLRDSIQSTFNETQTESLYPNGSPVANIGRCLLTSESPAQTNTLPESSPVPPSLLPSNPSLTPASPSCTSPQHHTPVSLSSTSNLSSIARASTFETVSQPPINAVSGRQPLSECCSCARPVQSSIPITTIGTPVSCITTPTNGTVTRIDSSDTLNSHMLKHLAAVGAVDGNGHSIITDHHSSPIPNSLINGATPSNELKRERYPSPPLGKIDDPLTYGINLRISGELVHSSDVESWEFPDMPKLKLLRDRLILFMEENRLKQADICRFTGLGAPYLSFMVKDPTISNFSSRRRVEVYSVLQTFFTKIDSKEVTLDDIARLVLLSKATARAANSRRRGAQAKTSANGVRRQREGNDTEKSVVRRRRRGRPKMLERSREDEFLNSGMKEGSSEFNFDDFIGGSHKDYLCHGLSDGGGSFGGLSDLAGWNSLSGTRQRSTQQRVDLSSGFSGGLEEWRRRAPALFSGDGNLDLLGSASSSGIQTPVGFRCVNPQSSSNGIDDLSNGYYNLGDLLERSQNLLDPQNQHAILQSLVNVAIISSRKEDEEQFDELKRKDHEGTKSEDGNATSVPESQTEILNALIYNLFHNEKKRLPLSNSLSQVALSPGSFSRSTSFNSSQQGSDQPPTFALLPRDSNCTLGAALVAGDSDGPRQSSSTGTAVGKPSPQLASILQAIIDVDSSSNSSMRKANHQPLNGSVPSGQSTPIGRPTTNKPIQTLVHGNSKIRFGRGWVTEVDVGRLNGDIYSRFPSHRSLTDDSEATFVLPKSGRVCAVRLQWNWDGGHFDEDVLWDMTENGSSIDAFIESYIRELGLPRNPIGTQLLQSFKKQVESARSFESMFEVVCHHLRIKLGHLNTKQLPGITRKIIIDCFHEGLRVIDAVSWNLTSSMFDAKVFLQSLIVDLNLPSSFISVLFAAFVRAIAKERLKFIHECSDVLLGNVRAEIVRHNAPELKKDRKRGHNSTAQEGIAGKGESSPSSSEGPATKRLRHSGRMVLTKHQAEEDRSKLGVTIDQANASDGDIVMKSEELDVKETEKDRESNIHESCRGTVDQEVSPLSARAVTELEEDLDEIGTSDLSSSDNEEESEEQVEGNSHELLDSPQPQDDTVMVESWNGVEGTNRTSAKQTGTSSSTCLQRSFQSNGNHVSLQSSTPSAAGGTNISPSNTNTMSRHYHTIPGHNHAIPGRPIFPLALKPTAMIPPLGCPTSTPSPFRAVTNLTRVIGIPPTLSPFINCPTNGSSYNESQLGNKPCGVPLKAMSPQIAVPCQQQASFDKPSTENFQECLNVAAPLVLRSNNPTVSRSVFNEAVANPSGLVYSQIKDEELDQYHQNQHSMEIMEGNRRSKRRSEIGTINHQYQQY